MYKNGFGINNLQWFMCRKTKTNQTKTNYQFKKQQRIVLSWNPDGYGRSYTSTISCSFTPSPMPPKLLKSIEMVVI